MDSGTRESLLKCRICQNVFDTDSRLPHKLDCEHVVCTFCLDSLISNEKKCKECNQEILYTSAVVTPFVFSIIRYLELNLPTPDSATSRDDNYPGKSARGKGSKFNRNFKLGKRGKPKFNLSDKNKNEINPNRKTETSVSEKGSPPIDLGIFGKCNVHECPVIGFCNTCNDAICKTCLVSDHFKNKNDVMCNVVSMDSMTNFFVTNCRNIVDVNLLILELHKLRIEAHNLHLEEKINAHRSKEIKSHIEWAQEFIFNDIKCLGVIALKSIVVLKKALYFYKAEMDNVRCIEIMSSHLEEICHSIDSIEAHIEPSNSLADRFYEYCPEFSYKVILTKATMRKKLEVVVDTLRMTLPSYITFLDNGISEENIQLLLTRPPKVERLTRDSSPKFRYSSEKETLESYWEITKFNKGLTDQLGLMPGEVFTEGASNIWAVHSVKVEPQIENEMESLQERFNRLCERTNPDLQHSSPTEASPASPSQVPLLPEQKHGTEKSENSFISGIKKFNKRGKKFARGKKNSKAKASPQNLTTEKEGSTETPESEIVVNKPLIPSLSEETLNSYYALIRTLVPSMSYIISTRIVNINVIRPEYILHFQMCVLSRLIENIEYNKTQTADLEIDINLFYEYKDILEKRSKCQEDFMIYSDCSNPFSIYELRLYQLPTNVTSLVHAYMTEVSNLPQESPNSEREYEQSKEELEAAQEEYDAIIVECDVIEINEETPDASEIYQKMLEIQDKATEETDSSSETENKATEETDPSSETEKKSIKEISSLLCRKKTNQEVTAPVSRAAEDLDKVLYSAENLSEESQNDFPMKDDAEMEGNVETKDLLTTAMIEHEIPTGSEVQPFTSNLYSNTEEAKTHTPMIPGKPDKADKASKSPDSKKPNAAVAYIDASIFCNEHGLDKSYLPYISSTFNLSLQSERKLARHIINNIENYRVPPILSHTDFAVKTDELPRRESKLSQWDLSNFENKGSREGRKATPRKK